MLRFLADIIPEVTVPPNPNGLPIAITQSPTLALSESPNLTGENISSDFIFDVGPLSVFLEEEQSQEKSFKINFRKHNFHLILL